MKTRRDSKDIAAAMLKMALEQGGVSKVDMLYGALYSNSEGSALLNRIMAARLLQTDKSGKKYHITREGLRFLRAYATIIELLPRSKK